MVGKSALVFGAYGNFGKLISRALLQSNIPVILAGRKGDLLAECAKRLRSEFPSAAILSAMKDINEDLTSFLREHQPQVLINTCGPFQTANYRVVEDCISTGTNYVDLADGRDFVMGMRRYDESARQANTTVITGASSVPALSSAVIEEFRGRFAEITSLRYGFSPGQRTTRGGIATVKGVMGYIGKPIRPFGNLSKPIYGWQDTYSEEYPGGLGKRLFGNCEVPDLDLFPQAYGIKDIRFSAGMESKLLHRAIEFTSWLIRLGLPIKLDTHAELLLKFSHVGFDWLGTDEGGMHMTFTGVLHSGKRAQLKWHIIVKKGEGPNVPAIPSIILARKICEGQLSMPGVHPCMGLVTLQEYLHGLKDYDVSTFCTMTDL